MNNVATTSGLTLELPTQSYYENQEIINYLESKNQQISVNKPDSPNNLTIVNNELSFIISGYLSNKYELDKLWKVLEKEFSCEQLLQIFVGLMNTKFTQDDYHDNKFYDKYQLSPDDLYIILCYVCYKNKISDTDMKKVIDTLKNESTTDFNLVASFDIFDNELEQVYDNFIIPTLNFKLSECGKTYVVYKEYMNESNSSFLYSKLAQSEIEEYQQRICLESTEFPENIKRSVEKLIFHRCNIGYFIHMNAESNPNHLRKHAGIDFIQSAWTIYKVLDNDKLKRLYLDNVMPYFEGINWITMSRVWDVTDREFMERYHSRCSLVFAKDYHPQYNDLVTLYKSVTKTNTDTNTNTNTNTSQQ
jgi:hypothetical protein